jgi:threonine dehydratase
VDPGADDVTLAEVEAAARRIAGAVRRTPTIAAEPLKDPPARVGSLLLKLELLQVTGSFKVRGALNKVRSLPAAAAARGLVTASGGNHGLAVAYASHLAGVPATIYVPASAPAEKVRKLQLWGAVVETAGQVWDDSQAAALARAERDGLCYVHPFADPAVIAGQGTVGLELCADAGDLDTVLVAVGGGGLIAGVATVVKALRPGVRVIGVEPAGAPTLHRSLRAGRLVTLDTIATQAGTLAPRRSAELNLRLVQHHVDDIVLVTDADMQAAARWLWFEHSLAAELSGAATCAALLAGRYPARPGERIAAILCGSGTDAFAAG